jgi:hypothetical protein
MRRVRQLQEDEGKAAWLNSAARMEEGGERHVTACSQGSHHWWWHWLQPELDDGEGQVALAGPKGRWAGRSHWAGAYDGPEMETRPAWELNSRKE